MTVDHGTPGNLRVRLWRWMPCEQSWVCVAERLEAEGQLVLSGCDPLLAVLTAFSGTSVERVLDTVRCPF